MPKVKRFVIFECYQYYPVGGWGDKAADVDTIQDVMLYLINDADRSECVWYDIVNLETGERQTIDGNKILTPAQFLDRWEPQCQSQQAQNSDAT